MDTSTKKSLDFVAPDRSSSRQHAYRSDLEAKASNGVEELSLDDLFVVSAGMEVGKSD